MGGKATPSQAELARTLREALDPIETRDLALKLLAVTRSREHVDLALRALGHADVLDMLDDTHRPVLREKAVYYFEHGDKDRGGLIREALLRLLNSIGHSGDLDLYVAGAGTYHHQPVTDTAQNLRAVALSGIFGIDRDLACAYATKLLGEPDTSALNGEPSMAAINVLQAGGRSLPVYLFVLRMGDTFIARGNGEVVSRALEVLGHELAPELFAAMAEQIVERDVPVALSGVVTAIVEGRKTDLYSLVERVITRTKHDDLHAYALIALAAARDPALIGMLFRLAAVSPQGRVQHFINAVELTIDDRRDAVLAELERRLR